MMHDVQDLLPGLRVDVERRRQSTVLVLRGDLVGSAVSRARAGLDDALRAGTDLVVDLTEVREIDSIGLGLLVRARWRAVERGTACRIRGARPSHRHAFETSRIGELLTLEP
jgi:anti-sigma B factor antagonist